MNAINICNVCEHPLLIQTGELSKEYPFYCPVCYENRYGIESMVEWSSSKKIKETAESLGKHEYGIIQGSEKSYIVAGSPLAFEDEFWNSCEEMISKLFARLDLPAVDKDFTDEASELRDVCLKLLKERYNADIVYGTEEF